MLACELVGALLVEHRQQHLVVGLHRPKAELEQLRAVARDEFQTLIAACQQHGLARVRAQPLEHPSLHVPGVQLDECTAQPAAPDGRVAMVEDVNLDVRVREAARHRQGRHGAT